MMEVTASEAWIRWTTATRKPSAAQQALSACPQGPTPACQGLTDASGSGSIEKKRGRPFRVGP